MNQVISFGGGVQSVSLLVMMLRGDIPPQPLIFANVGDDSENPATLAYISSVVVPLCEQNGVEFVTVANRRSLYSYAIDQNNRSIPLPVVLKSGAFGNRTCTTDWKIRPIDSYLKRRYKHQSVILNLGISWDESERAKFQTVRVGGSRVWYNKIMGYPLLEARMRRHDCEQIIADYGLPIPPKSSCFFCPFQKRAEIVRMAHNNPVLFARFCELETLINQKRGNVGKDPVRLSPYGEISDVGKQIPLFDDIEYMTCTGYCHV